MVQQRDAFIYSYVLLKYTNHKLSISFIINLLYITVTRLGTKARGYSSDTWELTLSTIKRKLSSNNSIQFQHWKCEALSYYFRNIYSLIIKNKKESSFGHAAAYSLTHMPMKIDRSSDEPNNCQNSLKLWFFSIFPILIGIC